MTRYIIGFLLAVGLIVVVIVLIIRNFTSGPSPKVIDLNSYANTDVTVQLTIDSPVTAISTHHDIIINVGNTQSTILITQGYEHQVTTEKSYPMDVSAYAVFLHALNLSGFTKGNNDPALSDERGHCALGDRYIYEVIDGSGNDIVRYWYDTCNVGTFQGDGNTIRALFQAQIPDYDTVTNGISL